MHDADPRLKKTRPDLTKDESDLDEEAIKLVLSTEIQREIEKLVKKHEKLNKELMLEGKLAIPEPNFIKEVKVKPVNPNKNLSLDKLDKKYSFLDERIKAQKLLLLDKDEGKTTALSTSKINYIDPRISVAWCKKYGVPIDKILNRALKEKFVWALDVDADWVNRYNDSYCKCQGVLRGRRCHLKTI